MQQQEERGEEKRGQETRVTHVTYHTVRYGDSQLYWGGLQPPRILPLRFASFRFVCFVSFATALIRRTFAGRFRTIW